MKRVLLSSTILLMACGGSEETTGSESTCSDNELAAETNFGFGIAEYSLFVGRVSRDEDDLIKKSKEKATEKFEKVINEFCENPWTDSAQIYLDSIDYYYPQ